jgi:hypothetical protein
MVHMGNAPAATAARSWTGAGGAASGGAVDAARGAAFAEAAAAGAAVARTAFAGVAFAGVALTGTGFDACAADLAADAGVAARTALGRGARVGEVGGAALVGRGCRDAAMDSPGGDFA